MTKFVVTLTEAEAETLTLMATAQGATQEEMLQRIVDAALASTGSKIPKAQLDAEFEEFWRNYPRAGRHAKPKVRKNYEAARRKASAETILRGVLVYAAWVDSQRDPKVKYAQGWLTEERWETIDNLQRGDKPSDRLIASAGRVAAITDAAAQRYGR